ncbi:unnamed protein product [Nyctereutes procyonoides]|uniref:(raccoon dog) hypothetical protein n=1 Tax=Nyctereutes procyonoides TaxID=34880 RepID=A0A811Z0C7_NYCPR|nr:unnamed protein product [Nyctereutes procyonoides]
MTCSICTNINSGLTSGTGTAGTQAVNFVRKLLQKFLTIERGHIGLVPSASLPTSQPGEAEMDILKKGKMCCCQLGNHHILKEPLLPALECHFTWSPLTGEKFVEVYKEAHLLALQIQSKSKNKAAQDVIAEELWSQGSLKRETNYPPDSPLGGLPLWGTQTPSGMALPMEPRNAHPPHQAETQKMVISKLVPPGALSVRGKNIHVATEQPMKRIPASPSSMKILNEKESHRDVPPGKSSAARERASWWKPLGPKQKTLLKPHGCAGGLSRKSSSSGSIWVVICSACASPAARRAPSLAALSRARMPEPSRRPKTESRSSGSQPSQLDSAGRARRPDSYLQCETLALPTPTSQFKFPKFSATPKVVVHRTAARGSQSLLSSTRTPVSTKHASALPTPASRRLSGLPLVTPKTVSSGFAPLCCEDSSLDWSFYPLLAVPQQALNSSPEKGDFTFSKTIRLQGAITPKAESTALVDFPLVDFGNTPEANATLGSESRPPIGLLINTPDVNRNTLIDLAVPLIQLSPTAYVETMDSPFLQF